MRTILRGTQSSDRKRPQHWVIILGLLLPLLAAFSATGEATTAEDGAAKGSSSARHPCAPSLIRAASQLRQSQPQRDTSRTKTGSPTMQRRLTSSQ